ncbi:uncharacterized protein SPAPADRAFT_61806 [Spathaspora passalidarum NRRL Y-27907]|uniref:Uncharacterized protein n=1 Tax=Spathaspora passalidarum (strain NRRL Y-27907 / 11-Y1) TaxID=619300 RepID=G3AR54_SPAPN|nr:uncharacterized protein SPAPADRAFT_61806 [Spathaspora passalidarum NRRL Y-27907]EGW31229.1 hypothetical protein SPAPADRAFT_61806 [Spathaspora passalidarum NRRL Y-27907]
MSYVPQTPERPSRISRHCTTSTPISTTHNLLTPCTATKKPFLNVAPITTPLAHTNKHQIPVTPEFTPQKSPARNTTGSGTTRRKKINDLLFETDAELGKERLSFGLLLPVPSTVGSGRKRRTSGVSTTTSSGNITFSQPLCMHEEEEAIEDVTVTATPKAQVITSSMVDNWHGKSFNNAFSDEEDDDEKEVETMTLGQSKLIPRVKLENPFIDGPTTPKTKKEDNPFIEDSSKVDYETHMELVNHRTGVKRIVKLNKNQMKIKPKKLSFI